MDTQRVTIFRVHVTGDCEFVVAHEVEDVLPFGRTLVEDAVHHVDRAIREGQIETAGHFLVISVYQDRSASMVPAVVESTGLVARSDG